MTTTERPTHGLDSLKDVAIFLLTVLLAWVLISRSLEPNAIAIAEAAQHSAESRATYTASRVEALQTEIALIATPTPVRSGCPYFVSYC